MTSAATSGTPITPDISIASTFYAALCGVAPELGSSHPITVQTFDENKERGDPSLRKKLHGTLEGLAPVLTALNQAGAGIFMTINETDLRGREARNIVALRAAAIEKDTGSPDFSRVNPSCPPSIIVESINGPHVYWLLARGEHREDFREVQRRLALHFDSDPVINDLPRVLRLPGFYHCKAEPRMISTVRYFDLARRYTIAEILAAYPSVRLVSPTKRAPAAPLPPTLDDAGPFPVPPDPELATLLGAKRAAALTLLATQWPARGRHTAQLALAGGLLATLPPDIALEALCGVCRLAGDEDRSKRELTIASTSARLDAGEEVSTWPTLAEHVPPDVVSTVHAWLTSSDVMAGALTRAAATRRVAEKLPPTVAPAGTDQSWIAKLLVNGKGEVCSNVGNAAVIISNVEAWRGVLGINERYAELTLLKPPPYADKIPERTYPCSLHEADYVRCAEWFTTVWRVGIPDHIAAKAMLACAFNQRFDPVKDYLESLVWDGIDRLPTVLERFGNATGPEEYLAAVGICWFVQAVARVYEPGCQADATLVLEGDEGAGKTSFFRVIGGQWFAEGPPRDVGSKAMSEFIRGPWITEFGELSTFKRADFEEVKSFLTKKTERYRPAYGRDTSDFPRRCVFGGTTNNDEYLRDEPGNRRFWPVKCGVFDLVGLAEARDQLLAEAVQRYKAFEQWHLTPEEEALARVEQDDRREVDEALTEALSTALTKGVPAPITGFGPAPSTGGGWAIEPNCVTVTMEQILRHVIGDRGERDTNIQRRIGHVLKRLGWEKERRRVDGVRVMHYRRK